MFRSFNFSALRNFPYFVLMRALWRYMGEYRRSYFIALFVLAAGIGVWLIEPYLIGLLFNTIQQEFGKSDGLRHALFIVLLIFLIEPIGLMLYSPARIAQQQGGYFVKRHFVQGIYTKLQNLPYAWHQDFHSGQVFDRIRKAESALGQFADNQFRYLMLIMDFFGPVIALSILFPGYSLACIVFLILVAVAIAQFDKRLIALYEQANKLAHQYAGVFSDYIANIRTIITLRLGRSTQTELLHRYEEQKPILWREYRISRMKWNFISLSAMLFKTSLIAVAIVLANKQATIKIGTLVMLVDYLKNFSNVFYNVGEMYQEIVKCEADYKSAGMIDEAYQHHVTNKQDESLIVFNQDWRSLQIKDLSFAYNDFENKEHTIRDIAFDVSLGEKIALVGSSGAGKSTLMTLLRGLYKAHSGHVIIDGKLSPLESLSSFTTLIPQDPEIFENTIRYNITFGVEHSDAEIMESCRIAGFDEVLAQLPKGLETDIREKGVNLSGGQKQRLALSRGIFAIQESKLVLLDEPTSSIDTVTEIKIFERLFKEFADKAMIASVHRLHLLARFDRIIVMDKGRIVEQGTLAALIEQNGLFAKIWQDYQAEQKAV